MKDRIVIRGARENNLKNVDLTIPRDKMVVFTGLSGSGKSSLAFDTIYAEGQRRYVESLSSYARMFLGQMEKPDVDYIDGLSPAISIDQKTTSKNPRSTVGTVTEIYDYLRLLWARVGTPHCPVCGKEIRQQTIDQIIDQVLELPEGSRIQILAPVVRSRKGEYQKVFEDARRSGYVRVRVDGSIYDLSEEIKLEKNKKHNIEIVVDRLVVRSDVRQRLTDSVETASGLAGGLVIANVLSEDRDILFSQNYACEDCGVSIEELTPRMFSFNNPYGACPTCTGLGSQLKVDPALIIPDENKSILEGAIQAAGWNNIRGDGISRMYFDALAKKYRFKLTTPWRELSDQVKDIILYGTKGDKLELHYDQPRGKGVLYQPFEGIVNNLERRYKETQSDAMRRELERGGQVYYLHNRVETIDRTAARIQAMLPEARVAVAHGKMTQEAINDVMSQMTDGEVDILVCTTIIETGIDIPNANTIIIDQADRFGLSQLYQIKGRVGRSDRLAYAYLMYSPQKQMSEIAMKRLKSIKEFTQLGSGYKVAMRDLTIRGAGDMLGAKQAGFIDTVGIDMYIEMLNEAIQEQKGIIKEELPQIKKANAKLDAYIPQQFAPEDMEKITLYQRMDTLKTKADLLAMQEEIKDNYGRLPKSVQLLFEKKRLEILINEPHVFRFQENERNILLEFDEAWSAQVDGVALFERMTTISRDIKIRYAEKRIKMNLTKTKEWLSVVIEILEACEKQ